MTCARSLHRARRSSKARSRAARSMMGGSTPRKPLRSCAQRGPKMFKIRLIPCLDVKDGRVVKGVRFVELRDAGDPVEQARAYGRAGADEVCFLDISASLEKRGTLVALVERVARELSIPFAVGGGVRTVTDAEALL